MSLNNCLIIVPMKDLESSKTRFGKSIPIKIKNKIVLKLFNNTLKMLNSAIQNIQGNYKVAVVTESSEISKIALQKELLVINDVFKSTLSESVQFAAGWAVNNNYSSICIIPADIAFPSLNELIILLSYPLKLRSAIICPSNDLGTNALIISPPNAINFQYGEKSFLAHINLASNAGLNPIILNLESMKFDVDNSFDVDHLFKINPSFIDNYIHE